MNKTSGTTFVGQFAMWLAVIGAVNWGLVGLFDFDLVRAILGGETSTPASALSRVVYTLVGLAGITLAVVGLRLRARTVAAGVGQGARA